MHLVKAAHQFFLGNNYMPMASPKIVPFQDDEEGHLIKVAVPGKKETLYLSRSPQLYKEIACLSSPTGRVYEIGSVFRGEPFGGGRRANEFLGLDVEVATANVEDVINSLKSFVLHLKDNDELMSFLRANHAQLDLPDEVLTIPYSEAIRMVGSAKLGSSEEQQLSELVNKSSTRNRWVVVTEFPAASRGFYQVRGDITDSFDLVARWEICSGGLRRMDVDSYFDLLKSIGWSTKEFEFYGTFKKQHPETNTGGYGIGLERLAGTIIGDVDIRKIQPYVRVPDMPITF